MIHGQKNIILETTNFNLISNLKNFTDTIFDNFKLTKCVLSTVILMQE